MVDDVASEMVDGAEGPLNTGDEVGCGSGEVGFEGGEVGSVAHGSCRSRAAMDYDYIDGAVEDICR